MTLASIYKSTACSLLLFSTLVLGGCSNASSSVDSFESIELGEVAPSAPGSDSGDADQVVPVSDELAELEIEDQSGLGYEVTIEEVRLSLGDGFLVITNQDGESLGYSVVTPDSQPVVVSLTVQVTASQELIGELFLDNGDGVFSRDLDFPVSDKEGEIDREKFSYTLSK
jgi:hypothetical protein